MPRPLERLVELAVRRPALVLAVVAVLSAGSLALAAWRLTPSSTSESLSSRSSGSYEASREARERFGDDAIVVLVRGDLKNLVLTENLQRLLGFEGCLSGNQPETGVDRRLAWRGSPCAELARTKPVKAVYGPATFLNTSVTGIQQQLFGLLQQAQQQAQQAGADAADRTRRDGRSRREQERAGRKASDRTQRRFARELREIARQYGLGTQIPQLDDPDFVSKLVFDRGGRKPKARFAFLFPNERSAMIQVRLRDGLSESRRRDAIRQIERASRMDTWRLDGGSYLVTGAPVVLDELARSTTDALWLLLFVAVLAMAAVLALVFRVPGRLLPLGLALASAACLFGVMTLAGMDLTLAALGVLPVLIGLAVDYAIQFQARMEEQRARGPGSADDAARAIAAARSAMRLGAPTIAIAALATIVGVAVLVLPGVGSPVPLVRDFAILLMIGIALAYLIALSAGTAAFVLAGRPERMDPLSRSVRGAAELLGASGRAAGAVLAPLVARPWRGIVRGSRAVLRAGVRRPGRVLLVALALAAAGWAIDTRVDVETDLYELVPQDQGALRDIETLERTTGIAGEIDVLVRGDDLARPEVVRWMREYRDGLLRRYDYSARNGCGEALLCPGLALPDLFRGDGAGADARQARATIAAVPEYLRQAIVTDDYRTASLAFGIKLVPFDEQQELVEDMRSRLSPPAGVDAELAGLPVLAAQAGDDLSSPWRRLGILAVGLAAVGLALLLAQRRRLDALLPLIPIAFATGWSALVLFATRVPLNPLSATLGTLVLAISTEFAVLLYARYRQERASAGLEAALERTYATTGMAVLASGATAIAGFAVLVASDIAVLRDFGLVTVIDLAVALLGVLAVLPATLAFVERRRRTAEPGGAGGSSPAPATERPRERVS